MFSMMNPVLFIFLFIIAFILQLIGIYVSAFIFHAFVKLFGGRGDYACTFNVIAYSSFVFLLSILGGFIFDVLELFLGLIGIIFQSIFHIFILFAIVRIFMVAYRRLHKLNMVRSFAALLLPFLLFGAFQYFSNKLDKEQKSLQQTLEDSGDRLRKSMTSVFEAKARMYVVMLKVSLKEYYKEKAVYPSSIKELTEGPVPYLTTDTAGKLIKASSLENHIEGYYYEYVKIDDNHFQVYARAVETKVPDGRVFFFNEQFLLKVGVPEGELLGKPATKEDMLHQLQSKDSFKSASAARWLGENKIEEAIKSLIKCLNNSESWKMRDYQEALMQIGKPAVEDLLWSLQNDDGVNKEGIIEVLKEIKDVQVTQALSELLPQSNNHLKITILRALKKLKATEAVSAIIPLLKSEDKEVRSAAAYALIDIPHEQAIEPLKEALKDDYYNVKMYSENALKAIGEPALNSLISSLGNSNDVYQRSIRSIIRSMDSVSVPYLIEALSNEDKYIVIKAASILATIGDEQARESVLSLVRHKEPLVRVEVARMLLDHKKEWARGGLRNSRVIESLIDALDSSQIYIQNKAMKVLWSITGKSFGANKEKWEEWWEHNKEMFK